MRQVFSVFAIVKKFFIENKLVILILFGAAFIRLYAIGNFDVSPDEHHFIHEAFRFLTGDPYMVPRHHPFQHGAPFVGHPFLAQDIMYVFFKLFGPSIAVGRSVMAVANIWALIGTYVLARLLFNKRVAFFSLVFLAFLPHDIRYARDAHLDPLLGANLVWTCIFLWKFLKSQKYIWSILLGVSTALVVATKINGPFIFLMFGLVGIVFLFHERQVRFIKERSIHVLLAFTTFFILFYILVSPQAYLDALIHPMDPYLSDYKLQLHIFFTTFFRWNAKIVLYLYTLPFFLLVVAGLYSALKRRGLKNLYIICIFLVYSHIFFTHNGHSGEYGYITLNPYFSIFAGLGFVSIKKSMQKYVLLILFLFVIPIIILHGLRIDFVGVSQLSKFNDSNFRFGQTTYHDAVKEINNLPGNPVVLWIRDKDRTVPFLEIRGGIKLWTFINEGEFDTILTADKDNVEGYTNKNFFMYKTITGKNEKLWILRKS